MYIRRAKQKIFGTLAIFLVIGGFLFIGYKITLRDERKELAAAAARAKIQPLVETAAKLEKAAESYEAKFRADGDDLPPGKVISIDELAGSSLLKKEELDSQIEIENFSYQVLPKDASEKTVKMILVTNRGRVTVNKKGEGALFDK